MANKITSDKEVILGLNWAVTVIPAKAGIQFDIGTGFPPARE
jgi:hypothetical protein